MEPRFSNYIIFFHISDICHTAVLTAVSIIPENKIFVIPKFHFICCHTGIFDGSRNNIFLVKFSINIYFPIFDLYRIPRTGNDPPDLIMGFFISIRQKNDDIALLWRAYHIDKAIDKNLFLAL